MIVMRDRSVDAALLMLLEGFSLAIIKTGEIIIKNTCTLLMLLKT